MKRNFKGLVKLLTVISLTFALSLSVFASVDLVSSESVACTYALDSVHSIARSSPQEGWSTETEISEGFPVYDFNYSINGYLFNLSTNDQDSGYIHIFIADDNYSVLSYCFAGTHFANKRLWECIENETVQPANDKLIYVGNLSFYVQTVDGGYFDLYEQEPLSADLKAAAQTAYAEIHSNVKAESVSRARARSRATTAATTATGVKRYVTGATHLDIVMMSDFSGKTINGVTVHNHCAPTAATTIVKYWNNRRGITGLWYSSDWWVFSSLFVNMKTSPTFGTREDYIYNGFKNYSVNTRGIPYVSCDWWGNSSNEVCTFAKAQGYIDGNFPFIININQSGRGTHSPASAIRRKAAIRRLFLQRPTKDVHGPSKVFLHFLYIAINICAGKGGIP